MLAQIYAENEDIAYDLHMQSISALSVKKGQPYQGSRYVSVIDGVAVMGLIGPIFPRANMMTEYSGAVSVQQYVSDFLRAYNDPDIVAIVEDIDSPGGDVRGVGDGADIMFAAAKENRKPIYAFASGYMASAAYYLGAPAQKVYASKGSMVGSIGVILTAQKKSDNTIEIISSISKYKRVDPSKPEGREVLEQQVNDLGFQFRDDVMRYRGIDEEKFMADYGQGNVFYGPRAQSQGLVDDVSTLGHVIEEAARAGSKHSTPLNQRANASVSPGFVALLEATMAERVHPFGASIQFSDEQEETMGLKDIVAKFKADKTNTVVEGQTTADNTVVTPAVEGTTDAVADAAAVVPPVTNPAVAAQQPTRADLEDRFSDKAELFAERMISGNKIFPTEASHAASDLMNAAIDDALVGGTVQYVDASTGELVEGTREAACRARYEARPVHTLTQQAVKGITEGTVAASVLAAGDATTDIKASEADTLAAEVPMSAERKAFLMNSSTQGQVVLRRTEGK